MGHRRSWKAVGAIAACAALVVAACSSSSKTTTSGGGSSGGAAATPGLSTQCGIPNQRLAANSSGSPKTGGTLTMLGDGDVDYMDPNVSYYAIGYLGLRMWSRQLYTYPAVNNQTTSIVPDLATALPTITDNGTKYAVTIKT